tara:strand:+ start:301 stop:567 length:267 start_codon:yes stop_codon:yes gene_type:complete
LAVAVQLLTLGVVRLALEEMQLFQQSHPLVVHKEEIMMVVLEVGDTKVVLVLVQQEVEILHPLLHLKVSPEGLDLIQANGHLQVVVDF